MIFARVVGNVVATCKTNTMKGFKLMLLQPLDSEGKPAGDEVVAADGNTLGDRPGVEFVLPVCTAHQFL